jgi:hypothetical protein
VIRMIAQHFANQIVQTPIGIQRGGCERSIERHDVRATERLPARIKNFCCNRSRSPRARYFRSWLRYSARARWTHVKSRLRTRFDESDVLKMDIGLDDRRHTNFRGATHRAHGWNAFVQERWIRRHEADSVSNDQGGEHRARPSYLLISWVRVLQPDRQRPHRSLSDCIGGPRVYLNLCCSRPAGQSASL